MNNEEMIRVEEAISYLRSKKYVELKKILSVMNPADIAALFEELSVNELVVVYRLLPKDLAADTFVEMEPDQQQTLIHSFSDSELKEVMDELYLDDAVDVIEEMPANVVKRILRSTDIDTRKMINQILRYPEDSAGSIMSKRGAHQNKAHRCRQRNHIYLLCHRRIRQQAHRSCFSKNIASLK